MSADIRFEGVIIYQALKRLLIVALSDILFHLFSEGKRVRDNISVKTCVDIQNSLTLKAVVVPYKLIQTAAALASELALRHQFLNILRKLKGIVRVVVCIFQQVVHNGLVNVKTYKVRCR